jgi:hypothetical protein
MPAKEGWVVVHDLKQRWREVYAVLRFDHRACIASLSLVLI